MPFVSRAQQRYMFSKHPEIAKEFAKKTVNIRGLPERKKQVEAIKKKIK